MFCQNCGAQVEEGTKFCPKCGHSAMGQTAPQTTTPQPTQKQKVSVLAVVSAVLFGISLAIINPFGLVSIAGLVCAIVDLVKKSNQGITSGRTLDIVLIVCNSLSLVWFVIQFFLILGALS